jgi:hypothetical protein
VLAESRSNLLPVLLALLSACAVVACRKDKTETAPPTALADPTQVHGRANEARQSLKALDPAFAGLSQKLSALHREFDPLPPGLPNFGETRSRFYALSVALGALTAKPSWLSGRIESAVEARDLAELSAISREIMETQTQLQQADVRAAELLLQVQPFKKAAAEKAEELQAFGKTKCE